MRLPDTAREFLARHLERVRRFHPRKRIVFPEGGDPRILAAAERLAREELAAPILIGPRPAQVHPGVTFIDPASDPRTSRYAALYLQRRGARGVTEKAASEIARRPLYFATLMVGAGDADGFVGGAATSTAETVRAAIHSIGTAPGVRTVSGFFIVALPHRQAGHQGLLVFADCAVVVSPNAAELADIAIAAAATTRTLLGAEPVVALLSFSTKGSARHAEAGKIAQALEIIRSLDPGLEADGELQADAALVAAVGQSKSPGSKVPGRANTLVFPNLNAGNIGYKLVERLAGAAAFGPFLQGLAKPANDLSRACTPEDVYSVAVITALQAESQPALGV
ncbi:MAG: phosphate acetyltransferase [Acidobacteria bacterium]|nr:phosphate acetyltransferase [Acidobacteriota bacterium]